LLAGPIDPEPGATVMANLTDRKSKQGVETNPREVYDDVEVSDEALLDAGRGGRGAEQEAAAVLRVDEVLGVDGAEQARLVLLQRLPRAVVGVGALPCLEDAAVAGLLLLLLLLVLLVFAPPGGRGRRVEAASAAADAVHGGGGGEVELELELDAGMGECEVGTRR
jgi:hypothetical protein